MLKWEDPDHTGTDHGLAIDDVTITVTLSSLSTDHFRSKTSGNWNAVSTWESSHDGSIWFDATLTPDNNANTITIRNTHTVTVTAPVTADQVTVNSGCQITVNSGQTLTINDGAGTDITVDGTLATSGTVTNNGSALVNNILQINSGGSFTGTAPIYGTSSSLVYNGGTQSVGSEWTANGLTAGLGIPAAVTIQNSTTLNMPNTDRGIAGNLNINSGTLAMNAGGGDLFLTGNWTRTASGTFTHNNRGVVFNGSAATQTITANGGSSLYNLTVNKSSGKVQLVDNVIIANNLTLTSGIIDGATNGRTVIVTANPPASVAGGNNTSYVQGNLQRGIAAGANTYGFPIGSATAYAPVMLEFGAGTAAGTLTGSTTNGDHPNLGTSTFFANKTVNRFWTLNVNTGLAPVNYDATFNWVMADNDAGFSFATASGGKYNSPNWTYPATSNQMATSAKLTGLTAFSDFQIGNNCPAITAVLSGDASICAGASTNLSVAIMGGTGPYTVVYSGGTVNNYNSGDDIPVSPGATTTYTLTSVADADGCPAVVSGSATVTILPNVNAGTVSGTSPLCIGQMVTYTSNGDAGGTWSSTNPAVASVDMTTGEVTALTAGMTDITYTISTGCGAPVSAFQALSVSPNVNAGTVSGTSPLCIGQMATYTSNGDAGGIWSSTDPAVASVDMTTGEVTALTTGTTDITYTISTGCGAPVSAFKTLEVGDPEINITGLGNSIADGDNTPDVADDTEFGNADVAIDMIVHTFTVENTGSTDLTVSSIVSSDPVQFAAGALSPAGPIPAGMSATFTLTFDPASAGLQTATITLNSDACNTAVYDFAVQGTGTSPCPSITFTATPSPFCTGGSPGQIAITGETGGTAPYMYSIDGGMNYFGTATFTGLAAGVYDVKIKDDNDCESAITMVTVATVMQKTADAGADWTTCINGVVQLAGQIGGGATSSTWSDGGIGGTFQNANALTTKYTPPTGYNSDITITLTTNGPCAGTDALVIHFATPPTLVLTASAQASATCGDIVTVTVAATSGYIDMSSLQYSVNWDPAQLMYQSHAATTVGMGLPGVLTEPTLPAGQLTYAWFDPSGSDGEDLADGSTLLTITFKVISSSGFANVNVAGTPTPIEGTNSQFCVLPYNLQNLVNIALNPITVDISGVSTICSGQSTMLTATAGAAYSWNTGQSTQTITVSPSTTTTYTVLVTDANGCSATASQTVTVNPTPMPVITGTLTICEGASTTLTASGGGTYLWDNGETTASITVSPDVTTDYFVTVTLNGCSGYAEATVTVNPLETVNAGPDQSTCSNGFIQLDGMVGGGATGGSWTASVGGGTFSPNNTTLDAFYFPPANYMGAIEFTLTTNGPCPVTDVMTVNYGTLPPLVLTAAGPSTAVCGDMITFTVTATSGFNDMSSLQYSLNWNPAVLMFVSHSETSIGGGAPGFNDNNTGTGSLTYAWADPMGFEGEDLADGTVLQTVVMKVLVSAGDYGVSITNTPLAVEATTAQLCVLPFTLVNETTTLEPIEVTCPADQAVCLYDAAFLLTGGMPAGGTYSGAGVNANMFDPAAAGIGAHTITYSYTAPSGCSNTCTFVITVNPTPDVNQPANQVLCNGEMTTAVSFTGSIMGTVFNWTNNDPSIGLAASGSGDISAFVATNTTNAPVVATITVTPAYTFGGTTCYGSAKTFTITVNPTPTVDDPADQFVCNGDMTSVTFTGFVPGTDYAWTNDNISIGLPASGVGDIASFTAINAGNTTQVANLTVTPSYTNAGVTCTGTPQTFSITVYPTPDVVATPAAQTICSGSAITDIVLSGGVSGTTYSWSRDNVGVVTGIAGTGNGDISGSLVNTTNSAVTVTFTITPSANGCDGAPVTATVVVNPIPTVNDPLDQAICNGDPTVAITFNGAVSGTVYSWTNDNTSIGLGMDGTGDIASFTAINTGNTTAVANLTVTPSYTNAGGTCTGAPQDFTITVYPTPDAIATPASQTICSGAAITTIALTSGVSGATFSWTRDNVGVVTGIAGSGNTDISGNLTNTTNAPVTVTFTITPSANGCDGAPVMATVVVNPVPTVNDPLDQEICNGDPTASIMFSGAVSGTVYSWTNDNASIGLGVSGTGDIASFNAINTGSTTVVANLTVTPSYTNAGETCTGTPQDFTITVYPTPDAVATPASQTICSGETITTIVLSGAVAGTTYSWTRDNVGDVTGIAGSGTTDISGSLTNTTNMPVTVTFTITPTANGCTGPSTTATVLVNPTPDAVATPASQAICSGTAMTTIAFSGTVSGTVFNWTRDNTSAVTGVAAMGAGDISGTLVNTTNAPVTVTFTITPVANGCSGTPITATVTVYPIPSGANDNTTICSGMGVAYDLQQNVNTLGNGVVSNFSWLALANNPNVSGESLSATTGDILNDVLTSTSNVPETVLYRVTPMSDPGDCAGAFFDVFVTVNPLPTAATSDASDPICSGSQTDITVSNPNNVAGTTYNWSAPATPGIAELAAPVSMTNVPLATHIQQTLTNTTSLPVLVTFTVTAVGPAPQSCEGPSVTETVLVNPLPAGGITASSGTICNGSSVMLTFTATAGAGNFDIVVNGTTYTNVVSGSVFATVSPSMTTLYTLSSIVDKGVTPNCTNSSPGSSVTVMVTPSPTAVLSGDATICNGQSTLLSLAVTGSGTISGALSDGTMFSGSAPTITVNVSPTSTTVYTITSLTDDNCTGLPADLTGSATVTVNDRPTAVLSLTGAGTICNGDMTILELAVTGSGTISGTLSDGTVFSGSAPTITVNVSPSMTTNYTISTLMDANCSALAADLSGSASVTVNPRPTASISGSAVICDGMSATLTLAVTGTGTLSGSLSDGTMFSGTAPTITVNVSPSMTTVYTVSSLMDDDCAAIAADLTGSATVTVNPRPTAVLSGATTICAGLSATLTLTVTGSGALSGTLSDGTAFSGTAPTITVMVMPAMTTTYTVATLMDDNCSAIAADLTGDATVTVDNCSDITGKIIWEGDRLTTMTGVNLTTVNLTGSDTDSDITGIPGTYTLTGTMGNNFIVTPVKNRPMPHAINGLTAADASRIQQHVLGTFPFTDTYKMIAADANKSNSITAADANLIQQAVLGSPPAQTYFANNTWRFVPKAYVFPDPLNPWSLGMPPYFPEEITLMTGASDQDFIGMKLGDVNTTANPVNFSGQIPDLKWLVDDRILENGAIFVAEFKAQNFEDMLALQFGLLFDPTTIQFLEIETIAGSPLQMGNFGLFQSNIGEIRAFLARFSAGDYPDGMPAFRVKFKALQTGKKLSEVLALSDAVLLGEAYNSNYVAGPITLEYATVTTSTVDLTEASFQLLQNRPNPFTETTIIGFVLSEAGDAQIRVLDVSGRLVAEQKGWFSAGYNEVLFKADTYSGQGLLYYELITDKGALSKKMVLVRK